MMSLISSTSNSSDTLPKARFAMYLHLFLYSCSSIIRTLNLILSKTLVVNEWHYARFSMNGIPNGFGPSGIETKLLTHRYLEQKSYYISYHLTKSPLQGLIALDTTRVCSPTHWQNATAHAKRRRIILLL